MTHRPRRFSTPSCSKTRSSAGRRPTAHSRQLPVRVVPRPCRGRYRFVREATYAGTPRWLPALGQGLHRRRAAALGNDSPLRQRQRGRGRLCESTVVPVLRQQQPDRDSRSRGQCRGRGLLFGVALRRMPAGPRLRHVRAALPSSTGRLALDGASGSPRSQRNQRCLSHPRASGQFGSFATNYV